MMLFNLYDGFRRWRRVQRRIEELRRLDDSELNDLGIGRWRIPDIAREA